MGQAYRYKIINKSTLPVVCIAMDFIEEPFVHCNTCQSIMCSRVCFQPWWGCFFASSMLLCFPVLIIDRFMFTFPKCPAVLIHSMMQSTHPLGLTKEISRHSMKNKKLIKLSCIYVFQ